MDSAIVIINFVAYLLTFLWFYRKQRRFTMGVFLLFCYTLIAFFCVINYNNDPLQWKFSAEYFVYLYVAILLLLLPFLRNSYETPAIVPVPSIGFYKMVSWVYIFLAAIACVAYLPVAYNAIVNPNWADMYEDAHEEVAGNIFTKFSNLFFHLRFLGLTLLFFFISKKNVGKLFTTCLCIMAVFPLVLVTISQASRGGFIEIFLVFIFGYGIFRKTISKGILRKVKLIGLVVIPLIVIYLSAVTISRFDDTGLAESAEDSVIYYLGHSMLTFAYGVADTIDKFAWGVYMFGLEAPKGFNNGTHFGTAFTTIVGNLYWDFGPVFSLLLILLINLFWKKMSKRQIGIPEAFILITYGMTLYRGVFVLGRGWGIQLFEAFFIYFVLKAFQGKKKCTKII